MNRHNFFVMLVLVFGMIASSVIRAQDIIEVQEFYDSVDQGFVYFDIFGARADETIYVYVESDQIDPYVILCDIDCLEVYAENDDISDGNRNSALSLTFPQDGNYSIAVKDCCDETAVGDFYLLIGYGDPNVLDGLATPNGAVIAERYDPSAISPVESPVGLTGDPQIQEFHAALTPDVAWSYFDLFGMQAGDTIYLYAESDQLDTSLSICDIDCEETFAANDDIDADAGNFNSALYYTFEADGDYSIAISDCCNESAEGIFHLLIGYNAPQVLTGEALPTGDIIAVPYEPTYIAVSAIQNDSASEVQEFVGTISADAPYIYYDIFGAVAGQTLLVYAESNEFDTVVAICDIECTEIYADNDDISQRNTNSVIEFTFPSDGDYSIAVYDCCSAEAEGDFLLQLGYNAPEVLRGEGIPNGAAIASAYEPNPTTIQSVERVAAANCASLELGVRPELSGPEYTTGTDNFLIHYTTEGQDAATEAFVAEIVAFVEHVLDVQTQQLHWPAPPWDCGEGGDTRFDIYLREILNDGTLGYAQPENIIGDNPNSEFEEEWAGYSYMVLDNDFQGVSSPLSVMRATVAHEFHHTIQFAYDVSDPLRWYYEATASWLELQTSPEDQDATNYTAAVFRQPNLCMGTQDELTGVRIYGEWLLIDSLAQDFGADVVIRLWENIAVYDSMEDYVSFLDNMGTTPQEVLKRYAIRNLLRSYAFGASFREAVHVAGVIDGEGTISSDTGLQEMSAEYVLIRRRGVYTFSINERNLSLVVVGIDRGTGQAQVFDLGQGGSVDTSGFSNAYAIVLNNSVQPSSDSCSNTRWDLTVEDGAGARLTFADADGFDATYFVPAG